MCVQQVTPNVATRSFPGQRSDSFLALTQGTALLEKPVFYGRPILRRGTHRLMVADMVLYEVIVSSITFHLFLHV